MPIIFAVGLFCCDKFEETPNEKVSNMSKLTKSYFRTHSNIKIRISFEVDARSAADIATKRMLHRPQIKYYKKLCRYVRDVKSGQTERIEVSG